MLSARLPFDMLAPPLLISTSVEETSGDSFVSQTRGISHLLSMLDAELTVSRQL